MEKIVHTIKNENGMHARPVGKLVSLTKKFLSNITISRDGKTVSAKSLLEIMSLGARKNDEIEIKITGSDEQEAAPKIVKSLEENF
jgi:phosphocarrier protein